MTLKNSQMKYSMLTKNQITKWKTLGKFNSLTNNFNKSQTKLRVNLKQVRKHLKIFNKLMIIIQKFKNQN